MFIFLFVVNVPLPNESSWIFFSVAMQVLSIELLELTRLFGVFDGSWFGKVGLSTCLDRYVEGCMSGSHLRKILDAVLYQSRGARLSHEKRVWESSSARLVLSPASLPLFVWESGSMRLVLYPYSHCFYICMCVSYVCLELLKILLYSKTDLRDFHETWVKSTVGKGFFCILVAGKLLVLQASATWPNG